jgi:hypothetical protein
MRSHLVMIPLPLMLLAQSSAALGPDNVQHWPMTHAAHRAVFCGAPGYEELTPAYSKALLGEIRRLEGLGLCDTALWQQMRRQAGCPTVHERPAPSLPS